METAAKRKCGPVAGRTRAKRGEDQAPQLHHFSGLASTALDCQAIRESQVDAHEYESELETERNDND
jgi:hypothetical protein